MRAIHIGRRDLTMFEPPEPCFIISITDPKSSPAVIPENPRNLGIYRVQPFHDIDQASPGPDYVLFDEARADGIAHFVLDSYRAVPTVGLWVAQCEAGVSRSAGVAAALESYFRIGDTDAFRTGIPNRLVYRLTLEALRRLHEPEE